MHDPMHEETDKRIDKIFSHLFSSLTYHSSDLFFLNLNGVWDTVYPFEQQQPLALRKAKFYPHYLQLVTVFT